MVLVPKQTDRPIEQNREPEINSDIYGQLIFDKGGKNIKWEKDSLFKQVLLGNLDSCMQINETRTHPHITHENKFKMDERQ